MDSRKKMFAFVLTTLHLPIVHVVFQAHIGRQTVCANRATRFNSFADEPVQTFLLQVRDPAHANAADSIAIFLCRAQERP